MSCEANPFRRCTILGPKKRTTAMEVSAAAAASVAPTSTNPTPSPYSPISHTLEGKIIMACCFVLFTIMLVIFVAQICARRHLRRRALRGMHERRILYFNRVGTTRHVPTSDGGLDSAVLKSLPVFTFSPGASRDEEAGTTAVECPVCLSEFQESEQGRTLPRCEHSFHVDCIDMWFRSHSTCPVCRSAVEPEGTATSCSRRQDRDENTGPPPSSSPTFSTSSSASSSSSSPAEGKLKPSTVRMLLTANIVRGDSGCHRVGGGRGGRDSGEHDRGGRGREEEDGSRPRSDQR